MASTEALPPQAFYHQSIDDRDGRIILNSLVSPKKAPAHRRIRLQEVRQGDEPAVQRIMADPENSKDDLSIAECSPEDLLAIAKSWTTRNNPLSSFQFLVSVEGEPVGIAGFGWIGTGTDPALASVGAAGVVININARGEGYGFEALRSIIDYGLRELKLDRIAVGTTNRNIAMRRLMEERLSMPATITEPDKFGNDLEWAITRDTWAAWLTEHSQ